MFNIDDVSRIVTISRGDSAEFPLFINEGTPWAPIRYHIKKNDKIYFGLMEPGQTFETAILKQVYDYDSERDPFTKDVLIQFNPIDTENLRPGKYYYTIKLRSFDPDTNKTLRVNTIIPDTIFYIV